MLREGIGRSWVLAAALFLVAVQPALGRPYDIVGRICLEEIIIIEELDPGPVPVGCEVIDCCPGCPGPGWLEWRILVEGDPLADLTLQWENFPAEEMKQVEIEGQAEWDGANLRVGAGKTILRQVRGEWKGRPPVAIPRLSANADYAKKLGAQAAADRDAEKPTEEDAGSFEVTIEQYLGPVVVNEYRLRYVFRRCPPFQLRQDIIDLDNNDGNDSAVTLLDGKRLLGCVNDEQGRGTDIINKGNVLDEGSCRSEVSVFSDDDAFQLVENVTVWTDATGDRLPVDLTPNLLVNPVSVWLVRNNAAGVANGDIANANLLYNTSNCGIGFNATQQNAAGAAGIVTQANACGPAWLANVQGSAFYTAGQLNAYYINGAFTAFNCINDRNISVVGQNANNQSLAHEFGHAFSLGHTNTVAAIPATNVMQGGGAGRNKFTEGQCFRVNVNPTSQVNVNGVGTGPTRTCADGTTSAACPSLALDSVPD